MDTASEMAESEVIQDRAHCKLEATINTRILLTLICLGTTVGFAQPGGGRQQQRGGNRLHAVGENPQAVGTAGVAWFTTWEKGLAEAKRSNRPIFFMSAAAQCTGISGVF